MKRAASDEEKNINSNSLKRPRMQSRFERLILSDFLRDDTDIIEESQSRMKFERTSSPAPNRDAASSTSNHPFEIIYSEEPGEEEEFEEEEELEEEELEEEDDEDDEEDDEEDGEEDGEEDDDEEDDEDYHGEEYKECYADEDDEEMSIYDYQSPVSEDAEISDFHGSDDSDEENQGVYNFDVLFLLLNSWVSLNE